MRSHTASTFIAALTVLAILALTSQLSGCGQRGPLYFPDQKPPASQQKKPS